jgi:hypothetical protein
MSINKTDNIEEKTNQVKEFSLDEKIKELYTQWLEYIKNNKIYSTLNELNDENKKIGIDFYNNRMIHLLNTKFKYISVAGNLVHSSLDEETGFLFMVINKPSPNDTDLTDPLPIDRYISVCPFSDECRDMGPLFVSDKKHYTKAPCDQFHFIPYNPKECASRIRCPLLNRYVPVEPDQDLEQKTWCHCAHSLQVDVKGINTNGMKFAVTICTLSHRNGGEITPQHLRKCSNAHLIDENGNITDINDPNAKLSIVCFNKQTRKYETLPSDLITISEDQSFTPPQICDSTFYDCRELNKEDHSDISHIVIMKVIFNGKQIQTNLKAYSMQMNETDSYNQDLLYVSDIYDNISWGRKTTDGDCISVFPVQPPHWIKKQKALRKKQ